MTAVQRRRRTLVRVAVWGTTIPAVAVWLAPHVQRQDGAWLLALVLAGYGFVRAALDGWATERHPAP